MSFCSQSRVALVILWKIAGFSRFIPFQLQHQVEEQELSTHCEGHKWSREELVSYGRAFVSVVSLCPTTSPEALRGKLLQAYFFRQGRGGFDHDDQDLAKLNICCTELNKAAMFFLAVGHLQP